MTTKIKKFFLWEVGKGSLLGTNWLMFLAGGLIVSDLAIRAVGFVFDKNDGGAAGYFVAAMWALMAYLFWWSERSGYKMQKEISTLWREHATNMYDTVKSSIETATKAVEYSGFLEERLIAKYGENVSDLNKEYHEALSPTTMQKMP